MTPVRASGRLNVSKKHVALAAWVARNAPVDLTGVDRSFLEMLAAAHLQECPVIVADDSANSPTKSEIGKLFGVEVLTYQAFLD